MNNKHDGEDLEYYEDLLDKKDKEIDKLRRQNRRVRRHKSHARGSRSGGFKLTDIPAVRAVQLQAIGYAAILVAIIVVIIFLVIIFKSNAVVYVTADDVKEEMGGRTSAKSDLMEAVANQRQQMGKAELPTDPANPAGGGNASGGTGSFVNGSLSAKEGGVLITDATVNPDGLPLYDGWSMDVSKLQALASSKGMDATNVKSWDTDYSQFWTDPKWDTEAGGIFNGLGDFTDSSARNAISFEGGAPYLTANSGLGIASTAPGKVKRSTSMSSVIECDGRLALAIPWRISVDPALVDANVLAKLNADGGLKLDSPPNNGTLSYNKWENMVMGDVPGVFSFDKSGTIYFDILFDDGTVLACMSGDAKGSHMGQIAKSNGTPIQEWCYDPPLEGYAHMRLTAPDLGHVSYMSIFEICGGSANNGLAINLKSRKVVGVRTYNVRHYNNGSWINWMQESR